MSGAVAMACQELVELVTDYLEGRLPAADAERFHAHLEQCSGCQMYMEQFRATIGALGRLPAESLTPRMEADLLEAFRDWRPGR